MSGDSFNVRDEHNNVEDINEAAAVVSPFAFLFTDQASHAANNIEADFFDAYGKNPAAAIGEWKKIKAEIRPGNLELPGLGLVDDYVKDAEKNQRR